MYGGYYRACGRRGIFAAYPFALGMLSIRRYRCYIAYAFASPYRCSQHLLRSPVCMRRSCRGVTRSSSTVAHCDASHGKTRCAQRLNVFSCTPHFRRLFARKHMCRRVTGGKHDNAISLAAGKQRSVNFVNNDMLRRQSSCASTYGGTSHNSRICAIYGGGAFLHSTNIRRSHASTVTRRGDAQHYYNALRAHV